jgi:hypothetical protein
MNPSSFPQPSTETNAMNSKLDPSVTKPISRKEIKDLKEKPAPLSWRSLRSFLAKSAFVSVGVHSESAKQAWWFL